MDRVKALRILRRIVCLLVLLTSVVVPCGYGGTPGALEIKLYFTDEAKAADSGECGAGEYVMRTIAPTRKVADAALHALFAGPNAEEKAKGLQGPSVFGKYYLGVTIKDGTAIINFRPGAKKYMYVNGPICMQSKTLAPMTNTLKQFNTITYVEYAINGKVIDEWDA